MRFTTLATAAIVGLLISLATPSANAAPGALGKSWARTAAVLVAETELVEKVHRRRYRHRHRGHRRGYRRFRPRIYIPRVYRGARRHRHRHCHRRRCHRHRHHRGHHR